MTIPEISPLFILSVCGLSFVCAASMGALLFGVLRFATGGLSDTLGGFFGGGEDNSGAAPAEPRPAMNRPDLRSRAQSFDFDQAVSQQPPAADPSRFGENSQLNPGGRNRPNPSTRDLNLPPRGQLSDNPDAMFAPPPPDFSSGSEHLPNPNSSIGRRGGRLSSRQRMDTELDFGSSGSSSSPIKRNRRDRSQDEVFGGQLDFDGDGDLDT